MKDLSPVSGDIFLFFGKNRQSVKILRWVILHIVRQEVQHQFLYLPFVPFIIGFQFHLQAG